MNKLTVKFRDGSYHICTLEKGEDPVYAANALYSGCSNILFVAKTPEVERLVPDCCDPDDVFDVILAGSKEVI